MVRFSVVSQESGRQFVVFATWSVPEPMQTALNIAMIIVSIVLMALILLQTKGSSFSGAFGGGDAGSINRTRRGVEKTLFQFTIGVAGVYVVLAVVSSVLL